jgi:hypothetical protein
MQAEASQKRTPASACKLSDGELASEKSNVDGSEFTGMDHRSATSLFPN